MGLVAPMVRVPDSVGLDFCARLGGHWIIGSMSDIPLRQYKNHSRDWRQNLYVYPVISRRSGGLSIGVNLNPDTACNFDCIYCQVDRSNPPRIRQVDPERFRRELTEMIDLAQCGVLFDDPAFADVPQELRTIKDIAFSGDGEPTTCKRFRACIEVAAAARREAGVDDAKLVLITDACYLTRPEVEASLAIMDENNGQIWAKLDAGTEAYFQKVNRPNYPLAHVIENIIAAARVRPIVIQSLFMRIDGEPPDDAELAAYADRLAEITDAGGRIAYVQIYTVARRPAEDCVTALTKHQVDRIVDLVRDSTGLRVQGYYGPG